jgi:uncharacterized membrane protein HdeD (DUF308 family)
MIARLLSALVGAALCASAFLEPRGSVAFWHDLIAGVLVAVIALLSFRFTRLRYLNTAFSVWLFFSGALLPRMSHFYATVGAGTLVFIFSLVPTSDRTFWPSRHATS